MAEFGAHVTSKVPDRASIFELLAQDSLASGLCNAFQYLVNVVVEANPDKYCWLKDWADEIYLAFDTVVEYSHLRAFKASFSEHFYGLKRLNSSGQRLDPEKVVLSFFLLTLGPYIKRKLDTLLSNLRHEAAAERIEIQSPQYYFVKIYPVLCFLTELSNLVLQVQYTVNRSDYYSLWCRVLGIRLVIRPDEDQRPSKDLQVDANGWTLAKYTAQTVGTALYAGAFFIQFLEYFYSREGFVTGKLIKSPKPPPPQTVIQSRAKVNQLKDYCLLCNEKRRNDTALSTSGFIFCYSCIRAFVSRNKKCPATGIPSSLDHLIRLFPPEG